MEMPLLFNSRGALQLTRRVRLASVGWSHLIDTQGERGHAAGLLLLFRG
jgi:hypothetical protein